MDLQIRKSIPSSSWYTGDGDTTINLKITEITINSKKSLIKTPIAQSPNTQNGSPSDLGKSYVMDLKRIEDTIKLRGWLEDDDSETAWNKAWKLRSMCVSGNISGDKGALTSLTIDNIVFSSGTQRAFLESVTIIANAMNSQVDLDTSGGTGKARIEVELDIYLGDPR